MLQWQGRVFRLRRQFNRPSFAFSTENTRYIQPAQRDGARMQEMILVQRNLDTDPYRQKDIRREMHRQREQNRTLLCHCIYCKNKLEG